MRSLVCWLLACALVCLGSTASALSVTYNSPTDVPVTASSYTATGQSLSITLNFTPTPGTNLTVVKNTGFAPINGTFTNVADGSMVVLSRSGLTYTFVASYFGGTGNDLVLLWAGTTAFSWGNGFFGQLGDGNWDPVSLPTAVVRSGAFSSGTIAAIAGGGSHTLALTHDGQLFAWGYNGDGELGDGSLTDRAVAGPVFMGGALSGKRVIRIAAGGLHSLVLTSEGQVFTWGFNGSGQLGDGMGDDHSIPFPVDASGVLAGKNIIAIACGDDHSLALSDEGKVYAWGGNTFGQLGDGSTAPRFSPVAVNMSGVLAGKTIVAIGGGHTHSIALTSDGQIFAWGYNQNGQLGNGTGANSSVPVAVNMNGALAGRTVKSIAAGGDHNVVLTLDGKVYAWGRNDYGQLGDDSNAPSEEPVAVDTTGWMNGKTITAIAAGRSHSMALATTGQLLGWGNNSQGQIGDGVTMNRPSPVLTNTTGILAGRGINFLACGGDHTLVLADGSQAPDISVHQPLDRTLVDGLSTVDFGSAPAGTTITKVFTIRNTGSADLTGFTITKTGLQDSEFVITGTSATTLATNDSTTFSVAFTAGGAGTRSAFIHISSNDPDESPFDIELMGTGLTESDLWRQTWFGNPFNTGSGADNADPDHDGLNNLVEFATQRDPTKVSAPVGTLVRNGANLEYSYICNKAAVNDGILFVAEWADDLAGPWTTANVSTTIVDHVTTQTVTATLPAGPNGHRFVRLRIVRP